MRAMMKLASIIETNGNNNGCLIKILIVLDHVSSGSVMVDGEMDLWWTSRPFQLTLYKL